MSDENKLIKKLKIMLLICMAVQIFTIGYMVVT